MSFLNTTYSATVAARLTQKGRNAIAAGNFNISYFTIGDSEFNYSGPASQNVLTPFDKDVDIKYPLWYTSGTTIYGVPVAYPITSVCNNAILSSDPASTGWTSNVVWEQNPIGYTGSTGYTGFVNAAYLGTKSYFGYTSTSGQTYYASTGSTTGTTTGTTITDTLGNKVTIKPEEQKTIAILHYTKNNTDPWVFFKYDDYIATDANGVSNFSLSLPNLMYHRSTGTTAGATFYMSTGNTKMMSSNYNGNYTIEYKDLVDGTGSTANTVGKIFFNQQKVVIDDEDIAAVLDPASSRTYTLTAPFVNTLASNNNPITGLTTSKTLWVTYKVSGGTTNDDLPCNYFMKVTGSSNNEVVTVQFSGNSFNFLNNGYSATNFYLLFQLTNNGDKPSATGWKYYDVTSELGSINNIKTGHTFTLDQLKFTGGTQFNSTLSSFGNTGTTFGTIQLIRSSDIEEMVFNLSLPDTTFKYSQNPTVGNSTPMITEVALLDANKNTLVMGKLSAPISRTGSQVIQVKLDF
jgi:hypothetical protein